MLAPLMLRKTLLGRCHHYLHFTDEWNDDQSWGRDLLSKWQSFWFSKAELVLHSPYSGSFILSFDSLMSGVNRRWHLNTSHRANFDLCVANLISTHNSGLISNCLFNTFIGYLIGFSGLTKPKESFVFFCFSVLPLKYATHIVFFFISMSIDFPSIHTSWSQDITHWPSWKIWWNQSTSFFSAAALLILSSDTKIMAVVSSLVFLILL